MTCDSCLQQMAALGSAMPEKAAKAQHADWGGDQDVHSCFEWGNVDKQECSAPP